MHEVTNDPIMVKNNKTVEQLRLSIIRLRDALKVRQSSEPDGVTRADINLCLAVRGTTTAFVDYVAWIQNAENYEQELQDEVISLMNNSLAAMNNSSHEKSVSFRNSICEKIKIVTRSVELRFDNRTLANLEF